MKRNLVRFARLSDHFLVLAHLCVCGGGPTGEVRKHLVLSISHRVGLQPSRTLTTWVYYEQLAELNNSRRSARRVQMPISKKRMRAVDKKSQYPKQGLLDTKTLSMLKRYFPTTEHCLTTPSCLSSVLPRNQLVCAPHVLTLM